MKNTGIMVLLMSSTLLIAACGDQNERNTHDPNDLIGNEVPENETGNNE